MSVAIEPYSEELEQRFLTERKRLLGILGEQTVIEHVGSTAVGIGGKNIVDILIGAGSPAEMQEIGRILLENGYYMGRDLHADRIFMASSEDETGEGDFHIHICLVGGEAFRDFIILRDFLRNNPRKAQEYFAKKGELARLAEYDREKYKALKARYVSGLLAEAKNEESP